MANDRLYLFCPRCGGSFQIAKRMGGEWYTGNNFESLAQLDKFFEEHFGCELSEGDPWEFELVTEESIAHAK